VSIRRTVYLAGPISGLTYDSANDWRAYAQAELAKAGIVGLSPLRGKDYLRSRGVLKGDADWYGDMGVFATQRGIMTRDRFDAQRCDVLLVNFLGAKTVSIGTCMEIAWADALRTPIVCIMDETGNPHEHVMLKEAIGFRVTTLEAGLAVVKTILEYPE
jgi:nucleoside 2-deoxyribosyltransferase